MSKDVVLHLDHDHQRYQNLAPDLKAFGIELHKASSVLKAKEMLKKNTYALFLIQLETARKQIYEFHSFIRSENNGAIVIVLLAKPQGEIESQLFDCGVDDVVIGNPICCSALVSRIKRRFYNGKLSLVQTDTIQLKGGGLINFARREVRLDGYTFMLSRNTEKLLRYFLDNPDRVITRDEMLKYDIWDMSVAQANKEQEGKAFDMAIGRLRKAIEIDPQSPQIIKTVYGKGWMLARDAVLQTVPNSTKNPKLLGLYKLLY